MAQHTKRHSLALPDDLLDEVKAIAQARQTTVVEAVRRLLRLGLIVGRLAETPNTDFIIREAQTERQVILI